MTKLIEEIEELAKELYSLKTDNARALRTASDESQSIGYGAKYACYSKILDKIEEILDKQRPK